MWASSLFPPLPFPDNLIVTIIMPLFNQLSLPCRHPYLNYDLVVSDLFSFLPEKSRTTRSELCRDGNDSWLERGNRTTMARLSKKGRGGKREVHSLKK